MDPKMMQKMMMEGTRAFLRTSMDSMTGMQDQMEKMWRTMLEQSGSVQKEAEKAFTDWMDNMRKAREEFNRNLEEGLRKMEEMLGEMS